MSAYLSPLFGSGVQCFDNQARVLNGGKLYTYQAGTTTVQATWTSSTQTVPNANPIILDSAGRYGNEVWLQGGSTYKFVLTDSAGNTLGTWDNVAGINDANFAAFSEWVTYGVTPTYISGTSFSVPGDQRNTFQVGRRVQAFLSGSTVYGSVTTSAFTTLTTVTLNMDSTVLDSSLFAVAYGFMAATNPSLPVNTYAPIASPTFTGTPKAPTPSLGDSSTNLATTAFAMTMQSPAFSGTPTAPTAAVGTNTTQIATMAALIAQAFATALPNQAGNSGKFVTTNGTTASWAFAGISTLASTVTANITLASGASPSIYPLATTGIGQAITAPDATTLLKGLYAVLDGTTNGYPVGWRDSTGALRSNVVAPGGFATVWLDDNSTAAGTWRITGTQLEPGFVTIDNAYSSTYSTSLAQSAFVALDSNTSIHLLGLTANGFSAVVVDNTGKTLVTPVAIDAVYTGQSAQLFKVSATSALLLWYDNTNAKAVILTLSGSSPSFSLAVGSPVTLNDIQTVANAHAWNAPVVVALSSTLYAISYTNNASNAISVLALSVSGAVITQGSSVVITNTNPVGASTTAYALTSTTFEVLYQTGTPAPFQINAVTVSVAGTVCTVATPAGVAGVVSTGTAPTASCQLSATKLFVLVDNNTTTVGIYTITISAGTTTAFSSLLSVETGVTGFASSNLAGYTANNANRFVPALTPLTSTTALLTYVDSAGVSRSVVITETGGTPTKGTIAFRNVSSAAANSAGGGAMLMPGTTEFCAVNQTVASTAGYGFVLIPSKINGTTITAGTSKPIKNIGPNATNGSQFISTRLTSGDYLVHNSLNPQIQSSLPVFRSNGDSINYRGEISIPGVSMSSANYPMANVSSNRVVLIGNQAAGNVIDKTTTDQMRLINVEIAQ